MIGKFIKEEFNLIQVTKIIGGLYIAIVLTLILLK